MNTHLENDAAKPLQAALTRSRGTRKVRPTSLIVTAFWQSVLTAHVMNRLQRRNKERIDLKISVNSH